MNNMLDKDDIFVRFRFMVKESFAKSKFYYQFTYTPFDYQKHGGAIVKGKEVITNPLPFNPAPKYNEKGWIAFESEPFFLFKKSESPDAKRIRGDLKNRGERASISIFLQTGYVEYVGLGGLISIVPSQSINWYYVHEKTVSRSYWDFTKGLNGQKPRTMKRRAISTNACPHTVDGAVRVAEYIVDEIKTNVKSETANKIRELLKEFERRFDYPTAMEQKAQEYEVIDPYLFSALQVWAAKVGDKKDWDHKPKIRDKPELKAVAVHRVSDLTGECLKSHHHKYKGLDYFYDVWSNIHYGYVGLSVGFDENTLLLGSNTQQFFHSLLKADTPDDIITMKMGFELYKKFGKNAEKLQPQDVLDILDKTPQAKFPTSKKIHICYDSTAKKCKE